MRTHLKTFAVVLSVAGLVAAPAAIAGGGSSGSSASAAGAPSSAGGGGHAGGGGTHAGRGGFAGGARLATSYADHGGYVAHGVHGSRGGYGIVGSKSAGLAHDDAVARGGHLARNPLAIGPRRGSAAVANRVTDRRPRPDRVRKRPLCPQTGSAAPCYNTNEIPAMFCPAVTGELDYQMAGCPQPIKTKEEVPHL
jgi:hypothetical protein